MHKRFPFLHTKFNQNIVHGSITCVVANFHAQFTREIERGVMIKLNGKGKEALYKVPAQLDRLLIIPCADTV